MPLKNILIGRFKCTNLRTLNLNEIEIINGRQIVSTYDLFSDTQDIKIINFNYLSIVMAQNYNNTSGFESMMRFAFSSLRVLLLGDIEQFDFSIEFIKLLMQDNELTITTINNFKERFNNAIYFINKDLIKYLTGFFNLMFSNSLNTVNNYGLVIETTNNEIKPYDLGKMTYYINENTGFAKSFIEKFYYCKTASIATQLLKMKNFFPNFSFYDIDNDVIIIDYKIFLESRKLLIIEFFNNYEDDQKMRNFINVCFSNHYYDVNEKEFLKNNNIINKSLVPLKFKECVESIKCFRKSNHIPILSVLIILNEFNINKNLFELMKQFDKRKTIETLNELEKKIHKHIKKTCINNDFYCQTAFETINRIWIEDFNCYDSRNILIENLEML